MTELKFWLIYGISFYSFYSYQNIHLRAVKGSDLVGIITWTSIIKDLAKFIPEKTKRARADFNQLAIYCCFLNITNSN